MTKIIALGRTADGELLPLAVDVQGRLVLDSSFDGAQYLLLDGSRVMQGNLDLAGYDILNLDTLQSDGDLIVSCGTDKTLQLTETVYDDFIPAISVLATGGASPDVSNHTIQGVIGSYYGFDGAATEERLTVKIEMYHGYKEGSDVEVHVHGMPSTNNAGEVVWYFDYFYAPVNAVTIIGSTSFSKQFTVGINTQYKDYTISIGTIPGSPGGESVKNWRFYYWYIAAHAYIS